MYTVSLERIPLPHFSTYLIFSLVSFIGSFLYILHDAYEAFPGGPGVVTNMSHASGNLTPLHLSTAPRRLFHRAVGVILEDTWCFSSVINMAYCGLILVGRTIQNIFFGELRVAEQQRIRDKFWNFLFYKLVFIYGILSVESMHELLLWAAWSSILGFLHLLTHLTKDRYEFIVQAPAPSSFPLPHLRLVLLLCLILCASAVLAGMAIVVGLHLSLHLMFFMLAEVLQLDTVTIHVLLRYAAHFYDQKAWHWRGKPVFLYYLDLLYDVVNDGLDFCHNLHMLLWNNVKVNMAGLIIGSHLQYLYYELVKRWRRHSRYKAVVKMLEDNFPLLEVGDRQDLYEGARTLSE